MWVKVSLIVLISKSDKKEEHFQVYFDRSILYSVGVRQLRLVLGAIYTISADPMARTRIRDLYPHPHPHPRLLPASRDPQHLDIPALEDF